MCNLPFFDQYFIVKSCASFIKVLSFISCSPSCIEFIFFTAPSIKYSDARLISSGFCTSNISRIVSQVSRKWFGQILHLSCLQNSETSSSDIKSRSIAVIKIKLYRIFWEFSFKFVKSRLYLPHKSQRFPILFLFRNLPRFLRFIGGSSELWTQFFISVSSSLKRWYFLNWKNFFKGSYK